MDDAGAFTIKTADGENLFGHIWSAENPVAVVSLLHGFGEHAGRYAGMAAYLNKADISVVAIDQRGHGRSSGKRGVTRHGIKDYQADLRRLLDKSRSLFPGLTHILYGHSMGGGTVLRYGFDPAPDIAAFITTAPLIETPEPTSGFLMGLLKFLSKVSPNGTIAQPIDGSKVSTLLSEQKAYEDDPLNHRRLGFATAVGILGSGKWVAAHAAEWNKPLLIVHARDDELTSFSASEAFAKVASDAKFVAYDHVSHEVHNDVSRERFYEVMRDFILSHARGAA